MDLLKNQLLNATLEKAWHSSLGLIKYYESCSGELISLGWAKKDTDKVSLQLARSLGGSTLCPRQTADQNVIGGFRLKLVAPRVSSKKA